MSDGKITRQELSSDLNGELDKIGNLSNLHTTDKSSLVNAVNEHLNETMPHQIVDKKTGKTYKYGYQLSTDGRPQLVYEEVI